MAASIELNGSDLIVHIHGLDKLRAFRGKLRFPLAHVIGARLHPPEAWFDDVIVDSASGVGVYTPGEQAVGTIELADGRSFYDVHDPEQAIAIDLHHEPLKHLVLELDDEEPEEAVRRIERVLDGDATPSAGG